MMVGMDQGRGPFTIAMDGWTILAQHGLPVIYQSYQQHAVLLDEFNLASDKGDSYFLAVSRAGDPWPRLVVAQRYQPCHGFDPGIALVPETAVLFAGAGTRLLAYALLDPPRRLWEDAADMGFWRWSVHHSAVLMAAELELAAWTRSGEKLWSMFVEPPWSYQVVGEQVQLDVMGKKTQFPVSSGPQGQQAHR
jgi:hypothetical protein